MCCCRSIKVEMLTLTMRSWSGEGRGLRRVYRIQPLKIGIWEAQEHRSWLSSYPALSLIYNFPSFVSFVTVWNAPNTFSAKKWRHWSYLTISFKTLQDTWLSMPSYSYLVSDTMPQFLLNTESKAVPTYSPTIKTSHSCARFFLLKFKIKLNLFIVI